MSDAVWYVYQENKQLGPFTKDQLDSKISGQSILKESYLFQVGWKEWRPLEDCSTFFDLTKLEEDKIGNTPVRRLGAPRVSVSGRVVVHNNQDLLIGDGVNISRTGIFVETDKKLFEVGDLLKLTVKCDGILKPFNAKAEVVRYNQDPQYALGYGAKFIEVAEEIQDQIAALVDQSNGLVDVKKAK